MVVLSLFDGMSCGQWACNRAGIPVETYYASEIDKPAIKVTQRGFPETIQIGSVVILRLYLCASQKNRDIMLASKNTSLKTKRLINVCNKILQYPPDLILAGSPCQGFSFAGKQLNFNDPRSRLFFEFARILNKIQEINPRVKFLLENVRMKKEYENTISRLLGIQPILINSALVSAQNRERLYWTNIGMAQRGLFGDNYCSIPQPADRGILLKDILQPESEIDEKYYISERQMARILGGKTQSTNDDQGSEGQILVVSDRGEIREIPGGKSLSIDANYFKGANNHGQRPLVREIRQLNPSTESGGIQPYQQNRIYDVNGIVPALCAEMGCGTMAIRVPIHNSYRIRRLTPIEVERLQTIPDNYTNCVSDSQRYKMCGNGWNVDTVVHILKHLK